MGRKNKKGTFPYTHEKNGRTGKVYKTGDGRFKAYFIFGGKHRQKMCPDFESALKHLDSEFLTLDTNLANSEAEYPLERDRKHYYELEQRLKLESESASLWQAVDFYIAHHKRKKFTPHTVHKCMDEFILSRERNGASSSQLGNLKKHCGRFAKSFGGRKIHEIDAKEVEQWLDDQVDERTKKKWSKKTKKNYRGSLIGMAKYARKILNAILDDGSETEFQKVPSPKVDPKKEVEIYTPEDLQKLLLKAIEVDVELIPMIVLGGLLGLRPSECHGEETGRGKIEWCHFNWGDKYLAVWGQKVNSKNTRHVPISDNALRWLNPFAGCTGVLWKLEHAYDDRFRKLRRLAKVKSYYDGLRHSYASYRYRILKSPDEVASEMGNSTTEFFRSYRRNVTDEEAEKWFNVTPPLEYDSKIITVLSLRNPR